MTKNVAIDVPQWMQEKLADIASELCLSIEAVALYFLSREVVHTHLGDDPFFVTNEVVHTRSEASEQKGGAA